MQNENAANADSLSLKNSNKNKKEYLSECPDFIGNVSRLYLEFIPVNIIAHELDASEVEVKKVLYKISRNIIAERKQKKINLIKECCELYECGEISAEVGAKMLGQFKPSNFLVAISEYRSVYFKRGRKNKKIKEVAGE